MAYFGEHETVHDDGDLPKHLPRQEVRDALHLRVARPCGGRAEGEVGRGSEEFGCARKQKGEESGRG